MAWYNILFLTVLTFFIIKTLFTLILGDTDIDVDVDMDGDMDFDVSSMFSFKGILHFLLGFSSFLAMIAKFDSSFDGNGVYQFTWDEYVIAFAVGIAFMYILYLLYKVMMKFNHYNSYNLDVTNYKCTILLNNGMVDDEVCSYTVLVHTEVGTYKINVLSNVIDLEIGSEHIIYKTNEGIYYIYSIPIHKC